MLVQMAILSIRILIFAKTTKIHICLQMSSQAFIYPGNIYNINNAGIFVGSLVVNVVGRESGVSQLREINSHFR